MRSQAPNGHKNALKESRIASHLGNAEKRVRRPARRYRLNYRTLHCGDLMKGCDFVATGATEDEVMRTR
jgi:hypothetical protein